MGVLDSLLAKASGNSEVQHDSELNTVDAVLDFIMSEICSGLNVSEIAFKGGYVLSKLLPENQVRGTRDIDFSTARKAYYEDIKKVLASTGEKLIAAGVCKSYDIKEDIQETMSGGVKYSMKNGIANVGVDVGLHDISYGVTEVRLNGHDVNAFMFERMLADKISAMFTRKRFRRSKDLYDLYVITNHTDVDIQKLSEFIKLRGELDYGLSPIREEIMEGYKHAYDMLDIDVNLSDYGNSKVKPSFEEVIDRARVIILNLDTNTIWNHKDRVVRSVD